MTRAVLLAILALVGCATRPAPRPVSQADAPKTVTVKAPTPVACVDKAFPHLPAIPSGPALRAMPDFGARDAAVKGAWPSLVDWATRAEAQLNLCR